MKFIASLLTLGLLALHVSARKIIFQYGNDYEKDLYHFDSKNKILDLKRNKAGRFHFVRDSFGTRRRHKVLVGHEDHENHYESGKSFMSLLSGADKMPVAPEKESEQCNRNKRA